MRKWQQGQGQGAQGLERLCGEDRAVSELRVQIRRNPHPGERMMARDQCSEPLMGTKMKS